MNRVKQLITENDLGESCCNELCGADVMLVDDVLFNLIPLEGMLEFSFKVTSIKFVRGLDAIEAYQRRLLSKCCSRHFKLVLTDI